MNKKAVGIFIILFGLLMISFIVYILFFSNLKAEFPVNTVNIQPEQGNENVAAKIIEGKKIKVNLNAFSPNEAIIEEDGVIIEGDIQNSPKKNLMRIASLGSKENASDVFAQNIIVDYIKESGIWKVNEATWQVR